MKIKTVNITDQVVEYLKENIESGKWNIGEKIPSENQMVMELGVSRSSIRSALQYLIGIGVLKSYQGKGTFLINTQVENWDEAEYKITSEDCMDICKVLEFHEVISRTSGNPLLEKSLHKVFLESRKNHEQMNELFGYETGLHYHTEILEAFKNHDAERARDVMEQHLGGSIETLKMSGKIEDREGGTGKK